MATRNKKFKLIGNVERCPFKKELSVTFSSDWQTVALRESGVRLRTAGAARQPGSHRGKAGPHFSECLVSRAATLLRGVGGYHDV